MVDAYSRENGASLNPRNFPLRGLYRKGATHHTPPGIPISQPISATLDTPPPVGLRLSAPLPVPAPSSTSLVSRVVAGGIGSLSSVTEGYFISAQIPYL
jgi:hypothetical protein